MANMQELLSQRFEARKQKLVSMDIVAVAESLGMKLKPGSSGTYYWEEHDSFHIYPNTNTFRWWSRSISRSPGIGWEHGRDAVHSSGQRYRNPRAAGRTPG